MDCVVPLWVIALVSNFSTRVGDPVARARSSRRAASLVCLSKRWESLMQGAAAGRID